MLKKIWKLFAALSILMVMTSTSCAIYIGGGYSGKYYNLEWITITKSDYETAYEGKNFSQMKAAKELWPTSAYKNVYEKKTNLNEYQLRDYLKSKKISDDAINETFVKIEKGDSFIFYNLESNKVGILYLEEVQ